MDSSLFAGVLLLSAVILFNLAYYGYRRRHKPGARAFCLLMSAIGVQTVGYAFEIRSETMEQMLLWLRIEYVGASFFPFLILYFIREYLDEKKFANRYVLAGLLAQNVLTLILVWTNSMHYLYHASYAVGTTWGMPVLVLERGFWYYVQVASFYGAVLYGSIHFARHVHDATKKHRKKALFILMAILIPLITFLPYLAGVGPDNVDITVFSYVIMGSLIAYALYEHDALNLLPLTQEDVLDAIDEAVVVVDESMHLVQHNERAVQVFPELARIRRGEGAQLLERLCAHCEEDASGRIEQQGRSYRLRCSLLEDRYRVVVMSDTTAEERAYHELERIANRDALTGLYNRRHFMHCFESSERSGAFAILDIDHFKRINDAHGHHAGDQALVAFAKDLQTCLTDHLVCRYGGEEFAVFLEGGDIEEACRLLQRCRKKIGGTLTFSAGVSAYEPGGMEQAILEADRKLYEAKQAGRDRIVC